MSASENDESKLIKLAAKQVDRLTRANNRQRVLLAVVCMLVIVLSYVVVQVRHDAVNQCVAGNSYREGQTQIWDRLFQESFKYNKVPKDSKAYRIDEGFLKYVHEVNAAHNCGGAYNLFGL